MMILYRNIKTRTKSKNKKTYQTTGWTQNECFDVTMHQFLKCIIGVWTVHNSTVGFFIVGGLCTKFTTKKLIHLTRRSVQTISNFRNIWNSSFNTISGPFNFTKNCRHLVTIFWIIHWIISRDVDNGSSTMRHDGNQIICFVLCMYVIL